MQKHDPYTSIKKALCMQTFIIFHRLLPISSQPTNKKIHLILSNNSFSRFYCEQKR
uniref:Uncharacterized protein n=1 Tax=Ascaris lumbricoides TaxID=6252 RepID=A0A0M3IHQ4_ASCLU